jgi:hypothetical protein
MMAMKKIRIITYCLAIVAFFSAIFTFNFKESSTGMLPVINYPFREFSTFFLIFAFGFLIFGLSLEILTKRSEIDEK